MGTPAPAASNRSTRNPPPRPSRGPPPQHAILNNMVPELEIPGTEEGCTVQQLTSILTKNAENYAEDAADKTCSRAGCDAPNVCFLLREREQREHALLYRYLKCIQVPQQKKNLLTRSRR